MKRKMIIGAVALLATAGVANAQGFAEAKFGIKGGWNSTNITNTGTGDTDDSKRLNTFNAGVVGAIPLGSTFEIRTGLDLQSKGTQVDWDNAAGKGFAKTNPLYLELPVNLAVMLPFNEKVKGYIGAGPYGAVGIAGKNKWENTVAGVTTSSDDKIKWGNDDLNTEGNRGSGQFKRFDFGANIIGGVDFGKFGVHAQYGLGLTNTTPGEGTDNNANKSNQHRALGVSGVFYF